MGYVYILLSISLSALWLLRRREKIDLASGIVVGNIFFALIPMLLTLVLGPIDSEGLPLADFYGPSPQLGIFVFFFSIALLMGGSVSSYSRRRRAGGVPPASSAMPTALEFQWIWLISTLVLTIFFLNSGKLSGNHWADHADSGFVGSIVGLIFISLRAYIYALAILVFPISRNRTFLLLAIFTIFDVVLTGNRISVLYFIFAITMSRAFRIYAIALVGVLMAPLAYFLAVLYPVFRGVVWSQFGGFSGFGKAFWHAWNNAASEALDWTKIYRLFESYNVVVFQYIFETFGKRHEFLNGETVILKPMVFFVPRQIWPEKPISLNVQVGQGIFGIEGLSLNTLLLGEFFANFGWYAPFVILILISIVTIWLQGFRIFSDVRFHSAAFILAVSSWRHEFNYFVYGFCTLALIIFLTKFARRGGGVTVVGSHLLQVDKVS